MKSCDDATRQEELKLKGEGKGRHKGKKRGSEEMEEVRIW